MTDARVSDTLAMRSSLSNRRGGPWLLQIDVGLYNGTGSGGGGGLCGRRADEDRGAGGAGGGGGDIEGGDPSMDDHLAATSAASSGSATKGMCSEMANRMSEVGLSRPSKRLWGVL